MIKMMSMEFEDPQQLQHHGMLSSLIYVNETESAEIDNSWSRDRKACVPKSKV